MPIINNNIRPLYFHAEMNTRFKLDRLVRLFIKINQSLNVKLADNFLRS